MQGLCIAQLGKDTSTHSSLVRARYVTIQCGQGKKWNIQGRMGVVECYYLCHICDIFL